MNSELSPLSKLERLSSLVSGSSFRNGELRMACPAHNGSNPDSLKLTVSRDGRSVLAYCHSNGCAWGDVRAQVSDLYGVDLGSPASGGSGPQSVKRVWTYVRASDGQSVEQHEVRVPLDAPCSFRSCSFQDVHKHCWQEPKGILRDGFALMAHGEQAGAVPVICEGEKTAAAVGELDGFTGYSYFGGSVCASKADYSALSGAQLVLVAPDNDNPGRKAARESASVLLGMGVRVRVLDTSLLPKVRGSDLADVGPDQRLLLLSHLLSHGEDFVPKRESAPRREAPGRVDPPTVSVSGGTMDPTPIADAWRALSRFGHRILLAAPADPEDRHQVFVLNESTGIWRGGPEPMEYVQCETAKAFAAYVSAAMNAGTVEPSRGRSLLAWANATQGTRAAAETAKLLPTAHEQMEKAGLTSQVTVVLASELDPPGRYLGCANGVVDLDSGTLVPPADAAPFLVTMAAGRSYRPRAEHPLVGELASHLPGEERNFVLDSLAYALRGRPDRRFNVFAGPPNGGKTTVREAVWSAVGDSLAFALPQNALLQEKYPSRNQHDAGMTPMLTHRFAVGSEIPGGSTPMDAGRLKTISGGDSMALREPHEKHRLNRPASATVFLCLNTQNEGCNDLDRLPLHDAAVRDRVRIVHFPEVPGERDPSVLVALRSHEFGEAMLAELVRRCSSLAGPPVAPESVAAFVEEQYGRFLGLVGHWVLLSLSLTGNPADWVWASALHDSLSDWLVSHGEEPFESQSLSMSEIKKFIQLPRQVKRKHDGLRGWAYVGLKIVVS